MSNTEATEWLPGFNRSKAEAEREERLGIIKEKGIYPGRLFKIKNSAGKLSKSTYCVDEISPSGKVFYFMPMRPSGRLWAYPQKMVIVGSVPESKEEIIFHPNSG